MSVLVVGVSHKTAPVSVLEQLALDAEGVTKLVAEVAECEHVSEATALATCNRVEIYAEVDRFHGSVETVSRLLCELADQRPEDVVPHLYVHYDDGAVSHLFNVASGLDSMVVGEGQILGQARDALRVGQELGTIGPALNVLFQQALRVGKRAHAETDIDRAAPSLVTAALERATEHVGPVAGRRVVVVGAGAMAGLAVSTVSGLGAADIVIANRTDANASRLAEQYDGRVVALADLDAAIAAADVLISCTGSAGVVLSLAQVAAARARATQPLAVIDLALPHDVDPTVAELPGVFLVGLARLAEELHAGDNASDVTAVKDIVAQEITAFLTARGSASVTPTVVALRTMASGVVEAEVERLLLRLPDLDPQIQAEVELAIRRVADKLLH
ncbi:MAG: glutamyl-tRNA reductase, partial [Nocardioidaceae bacterium]